MAKMIQLPDFSTFEKVLNVFGNVDEFNARMREMRDVLQQIEHRYQDVLRGQEIEAARASAIQALNDARAVKDKAEREATQVRVELSEEQRKLSDQHQMVLAKERNADKLSSDLDAKRGRLDAELLKLEKQLEENATVRRQLDEDRASVVAIRAELDDKRKKVHQLLG